MRKMIQASLFGFLFLMIGSATASDSIRVLPMVMSESLAESFQSTMPPYLHEFRFAYKQDSETVDRTRLYYSSETHRFSEGIFGSPAKVVPLNSEYAMLISETSAFDDYDYRVEVLHHSGGVLTIGTPPEVLLSSMAMIMDISEQVYVNETEKVLVLNSSKNDLIALMKRVVGWKKESRKGPIPMSATSFKYLSEADHERFNAFFIRRIEVREDMMAFTDEVKTLIAEKNLEALPQYRKDQARVTKQLSRFLDKYFEQYGDEMFMEDFKELHTKLTTDPDAIVREIKKRISQATQEEVNEKLREAITNKIEQQNTKYTLLDGVYSPLVTAVYKKDMAKLKSLLTEGEDPNDIYKSWSAVNQAAQGGHCEMIKILVDAGADITLRSLNVSPLYSAIKENYYHCARYLLDQGAEVDTRQYQNLNTPLIRAAKDGYIESVQLLLEFGADPLAESYAGDSAIAWARNKGHTEIVKLMEAEMAKRKQ